MSYLLLEPTNPLLLFSLDPWFSALKNFPRDLPYVDTSDHWDNIITYRIVFYETSEYMEVSATTGKYVTISTTDSTTIGYCVVKFLSNKVTLNGLQQHIRPGI